MNKQAGRKQIGLSIDFDSIHSHMRGYGIYDSPITNKHYEAALPRILQLLESFNAKATFFLIAEEAKRSADAIGSIVQAGHEIACHSMSHPVPFSISEESVIQYELYHSKTLLEQISGQAVYGFRAPSWDASFCLLKQLAKAGYQYDASSFPSWLLILYRIKVKQLSSSTNSRLQLPPLSQLFGTSLPHKLVLNERSICEIPIATVPFLRLPYYHTLNFLLPHHIFNILTRLISFRKAGISYVFHAADFMSIEEDKIDTRIKIHPGMTIPLEQKLLMAKHAINGLNEMGEIVSIKEISDKL